MAGNTISLGEVSERTEVLAVTYNRCDRRGRLRIARLIAEHWSRYADANVVVSPHC